MNLFKIRYSSNSWFLLAALIALLLVLLPCFVPEKASAFSLEVKNTQVTLGGYAKLLGNYDINGTLNNNRDHPTDGDIINAYDTPLDGTYYADKEDFSMTARESRLYLKTVTPSDIGQITAYVEGDFNGDVGGSGTWSNSRAFRLRHAYGKATFGNNSILAGQCWTTFMDFAAAVPVMDLSGDPGQPFVRQPQVRFTHSFDKGHYLALAIENPDRGLTANGNGPLIANPGNSNETLPDVIVKYFWSIKNFHLSPKLLIRRFELNDESTVAYGASLTSHIEFGKGHKIYLGLTYGDGVGRYGGLGLNGGAGLTASGEIETVEFSSINAGVTINLRHDLAWTVGCGFSKNDDKAYTGSDAVLTANANKEAFGWHTNLKWKITPTIEYAAGVIGMSQEVMDGRDGDMYRVQNYIKYTF